MFCKYLETFIIVGDEDERGEVGGELFGFCFGSSVDREMSGNGKGKREGVRGSLFIV